MIRINLLPTKEARRKGGSGTSQQSLAVIIGLLIVEGVLLWFWYSSLQEEASAQMQAAREAEERVESLKQARQRMRKFQSARKKLQRQNIVFENLKYEKTGPPNMLKFLSYALTPLEDNLYNREELAAREAAGWSTSWDPANLWLTKLEQESQKLTIKGRARSHEDVAEFYHRVSSGVFFVELEPKVQEIVNDSHFQDLEVVSFEAECFYNYNPNGKMKMKKGQVPEALRDRLGGDDGGGSG